MKFAAFLRNVNLGRAHCPTRAQLEAAFTNAGGVEAASFQTNGTAVFNARSLAAAQQVLKRALKQLHADCGLIEPACIRSMDDVVRLARSSAFDVFDRATVYEFVVSFACVPAVPALPRLPIDNPRGDVRVLALSEGNALSVSWKLMSGPGSPNLFLEKTLGVPFSSRSIGTIQRLVAKHG